MSETLYDTTRDLHHACEHHLVGGSMADGTISKQWWADWIESLRMIHLAIDGDPHMDPLSRIVELDVDVRGSVATPRYNVIADELSNRLMSSERMIDAARYVITGAHLMGGQVTRKRIAGRPPCAHLHYGNRKELVELWTPYRQRVELTDEAREIFQYLLWIMDEILLLDIGMSFSDDT